MSIKLTHEQIAFLDTIKAFDPDFPRNLIPAKSEDHRKAVPHFKD